MFFNHSHILLWKRSFTCTSQYSFTKCFAILLFEITVPISSTCASCSNLISRDKSLWLKAKLVSRTQSYPLSLSHFLKSFVSGSPAVTVWPCVVCQCVYFVSKAIAQDSFMCAQQAMAALLQRLYLNNINELWNWKGHGIFLVRLYWDLLDKCGYVGRVWGIYFFCWSDLTVELALTVKLR